MFGTNSTIRQETTNMNAIAVALRQTLTEIYRSDSRKIYATLVRLLGDMDLAEEALQEAFSAAASVWARDGIPDKPVAWLISTGKNKAIDQLRKRGRLEHHKEELQRRYEELYDTRIQAGSIEDDRLRLIFTCCHPAIDSNVRVALTLREVCGLSTEQISAAFLVPQATMAQRLVRGKAKIREAAIPIRVPAPDELPERIDAVLKVVYLVFNEGYYASSGTEGRAVELAEEAIRLCRLLSEMLPEPEVMGLLSLMLLHQSRQKARFNEVGDIVLLEEQDRCQWDNARIAEGNEWLQRAWSRGEVGAYCLQAAIAAAHANALSLEATPWQHITQLYDILRQVQPSPVVELNYAVALGMYKGPEFALEKIADLSNAGSLKDYHFLYAAEGDFHRRLGDFEAAYIAFGKAMQLAKQEPEKRFLEKRLAEMKQEMSQRS
jgi:RNA polymerase sigma-70 factor (ECF subfamily)